MFKSITICSVLLFTAGLRLHAQLYVFAGSPTPQRNEAFAAALVRIGEDGAVSKVASLASGATGRNRSNAGLFWMSVSQEKRKAVLLPRGGHIIVVDLDTASVTKECELPVTALPVVYFHLVDLPGRGLAFAEEMFGDGREMWAGTLVDSAVPCENSVIDMAPTDIFGLRILGRTGVTNTGNVEELDVSLDARGRINRLMGVSFPFTVPEEMMAGMHNPMASILVANSSLVAIGLFERAATHRILVYRRRDQTWHRLPVPSERVLTDGGQGTPTPWLTGFGDYLGLTEARTRDGENPETAGKAKWRTERIETGPNMAERFREETVVFPGRLHLYDMEHDRSYTIRTDQGDSEILLVEGGMVYYRVGDALFRASIGETELGPAQLIAKSEILGDAHWAFIRRP